MSAEEQQQPVKSGYVVGGDGRFVEVDTSQDGVSISQFVDSADNMDVSGDIDYFKLPQEYYENPYYRDMDAQFRLSSEKEMQEHDVLREAGYLPVKDCYGRFKDTKGVAGYGSMLLLHRPGTVAKKFIEAERVQRQIKLGERLPDFAEGDFAEERNRFESEWNKQYPGKPAPGVGFEDETDVREYRMAGGNSGDSTFADIEERSSEIKSRGRRSYAGFDGPANQGAVPDSPTVRQLAARRAAAKGGQ